MRQMISIVIPAYNVEKKIGACLDGLLAQVTPADEIIVVDDGSTDATRALAASKGVRVLAQANRGAAAARNAGAENARGEIVLFIDADSVPDAHWLAKMIAPFADSKVVGVSGEKKTRQKNLWARFIQEEYDYKYDRIAAHRNIDFVDSSTAAYRRDPFLANGGFDPALMEAEDVELSFRLAERGSTMILARDAIAWHTHPETLMEYLRRKYQYAFWRTQVYARYPTKIVADSRTPQTQKVQGVLAGLLVVSTGAALVWREAQWLVGLLMGLFVLTTLPFVMRVIRRDPIIAGLSPIFIGLSALAGSAGVALGMWKARMR